jgi:uncharacterized surface protein with fasciclin (FAS1) repeats
MTFKPLIAAALLATSAIATPVFANAHGDKMHSEQKPNIVETAVSVDALSTLVAAVTAADLVDALSADGPFTVFAPTNDAFAALPDGTVPTLLKPENKAMLTKVLTSHVVAGKFDAAALTKLAEDNGGMANVTTLSGATLTAKLVDGGLVVVDENGGVANVATANVKTSNGLVHVVTSVLLPM